MTKRDRQAGVTLLEVLVVLAIIVLIASLATPRLMASFGRAKTQAAQVQLTNISAALQLYYLDTGQYPGTSEGLGALVSPPSGSDGWSGPYLEDAMLNDPWGRPWIYAQPGTEREFDLMSLGRDGQPGGSNEDGDISL